VTGFVFEGRSGLAWKSTEKTKPESDAKGRATVAILLKQILWILFDGLSYIIISSGIYPMTFRAKQASG